MGSGKRHVLVVKPGGLTDVCSIVDWQRWYAPERCDACGSLELPEVKHAGLLARWLGITMGHALALTGLTRADWLWWFDA